MLVLPSSYTSFLVNSDLSRLRECHSWRSFYEVDFAVTDYQSYCDYRDDSEHAKRWKFRGLERRSGSTSPRHCRRRFRSSWRWVECCVCWAGTSCQKNKSTTVWTHESRVCWVSCVLSWHVLSEEQLVHYQRGHTSLECVECRVCWAGTSCQKNKSITSVDTRV